MISTTGNQISLHDATLISLDQVGTTVSLKLQHVLVDGVLKDADVSIDQVENILRYNVPIASLRMEQPDGEVLTLKQEYDHVVFVVQWDNFIQRSFEIVVYQLGGPAVALRIVSIGADSPT